MRWAHEGQVGVCVWKDGRVREYLVMVERHELALFEHIHRQAWDMSAQFSDTRMYAPGMCKASTNARFVAKMHTTRPMRPGGLRSPILHAPQEAESSLELGLEKAESRIGG